MKSEYDNKEMHSPEDFWPEAKVLLDNHFAKRRRVFLLVGMSLVLIISAIGSFFINQNNKATIVNLEKANTELKSNQIQLKNTTFKSNEKTNKEASFINKSKVTLTKSESPKTQTINNEKRNIYKNDNIIIVPTSQQENNNMVSIKEDNIILFNTPDTADLPKDVQTIDAKTTDLIVFSKMPFLTFKMFEQKVSLNLKESKIAPSITDDDYFKNKKKLNYFIGAYTGMQVVNKKIKSDPILTEYADIRNTSEKKINTVYFGINLTVEKNDFLLQTGMEYNTIGEYNNYEAKSKQWLKSDENVWDVYNKQIIKVDTVFHFGLVNYNQTIVNVKDSTLLTISDSVFAYHTDSNIVKANGKTAISYLELPLMIGYQLKFGKAAVSPFAGITVGYLITSNGMYINKTMTGIEEISGGNLINTISFNYQLQLQLSYTINNNLMLVITPHYRNNMLSVSSKSSGISTKYSAFGTSFGLSYKL